MHISSMIFKPVVVSRKELISWSKADREKQCFSYLCFALLSAVCNERRKKYSESIYGRASAELDLSQCCLQQLPPDDQFSDPPLWNGPIATACKVKASSKSRRLCALEINVGPQLSIWAGSVRLSRLPERNTSAGRRYNVGHALPCHLYKLVLFRYVVPSFLH